MNAEDADSKSKSAFICVNQRPISFKIGSRMESAKMEEGAALFYLTFTVVYWLPVLWSASRRTLSQPLIRLSPRQGMQGRRFMFGQRPFDGKATISQTNVLKYGRY